MNCPNGPYYTVYVIEKMRPRCRTWRLADVRLNKASAEIRRIDLLTKRPTYRFRVRRTWVPA